MAEWVATFWEIEDSQNQLIVSGVQFDTPEQAEDYGKAAFGAAYAGVRQA